MEKEDFINNILNSGNGITKAIPNDDLFLKIENKIENRTVVSLKTILMVAASIVLLVTLNIVLLHNSSTKNQSESAGLANSINKSNQLYN
jgi:hypothetical protein